MLCLYLMGLNISSLQIAKELDLDKSDVRGMIQLLHQEVVDRRPPVILSHTVECDEVDLTAWGDAHRTVCHAHGEYARDEDGDGFCEVHVHTMEGF